MACETALELASETVLETLLKWSLESPLDWIKFLGLGKMFPEVALEVIVATRLRAESSSSCGIC